MGYQNVQKLSAALWDLARRQHGVVARWQLLELGYHPQAIKHRIAKGRLHPVFRGVYAVGRPQLTTHGRWMAAVLSCGPEAVLSHESAAALWGIRKPSRVEIDVSVPARVRHRRPGIRVHRRAKLDSRDVGRCQGVPVTQPICTLVDLEGLRAGVDGRAGRRGAPALRKLLDRRTFALSDSELERGSCRSRGGPGSGSRRPGGSSTDSRPTSTGRSWD